ncbi:hypothetical protein GF336_04345 [Candidatus Woesearchaeota archaeon]|nr:hypothetical protein [Candidatus Woesearchaeota archaeon]
MGKFNLYSRFEGRYMKQLQDFREWIFAPLLKILLRFSIRPDHISLLSVFFGILFLFFIQKNIRLSLFFLVISFFLDTLDGTLARKLGISSMGGTIVDASSDTAVIILTSFGFFVIGLIQLEVLVAYILTYMIIVGLSIWRNSKNIPYMFVIRPRLLVYLFFAIYVIWGINILNVSMALFSLLMFVESSFTLRFFFYNKKQK